MLIVDLVAIFVAIAVQLRLAPMLEQCEIGYFTKLDADLVDTEKCVFGLFRPYLVLSELIANKSEQGQQQAVSENGGNNEHILGC